MLLLLGSSKFDVEYIDYTSDPQVSRSVGPLALLKLLDLGPDPGHVRLDEGKVLLGTLLATLLSSNAMVGQSNDTQSLALACVQGSTRVTAADRAAIGLVRSAELGVAVKARFVGYTLTLGADDQTYFTEGVCFDEGICGDV
jgi:hypothetical protein